MAIPVLTSGFRKSTIVFHSGMTGFSPSGLPQHLSFASLGDLSVVRVINALGQDITANGGVLLTGNKNYSLDGSVDGESVRIETISGAAALLGIYLPSGGSLPTEQRGSFTIGFDDSALAAKGKSPYGFLIANSMTAVTSTHEDFPGATFTRGTEYELSGDALRNYNSLVFNYALVPIISDAYATVTLDANGGLLDEEYRPPREVYVGEEYGPLPGYSIIGGIARDGYTLAGWFTARTGGSQIYEDTVVSTRGSTTLYAHWEQTGTLVMLDADGGSTTPAIVAATEGAEYGTLPSPSRRNGTFLGWFADDGTQVEAETIVPSATPHTLHAHWEIIGLGHLVYDTETGQLIYDDRLVPIH